MATTLGNSSYCFFLSFQMFALDSFDILGGRLILNAFMSNVNALILSWYKNTAMLYMRNNVLTVAVVAGIDSAFKSLHLRKLGEHLSEGAAALVSCRAWAFIDAVITLWKLQRQIPKWLNCVRLVLTRQTCHLNNTQGQENKENIVTTLQRRGQYLSSNCNKSDPR